MSDMTYRGAPIEVRFMAKVEKMKSGCWEWTAYRDDDGYGKFKVRAGFQQAAHRTSYELFVGPIPDGLQLDHLCRNPGCVNPEHLEPVTCEENIHRGDAGQHNAAKTHCPQGHPYDEKNTRYGVQRRGRAIRQCRACDRERQLIRYHERKAQTQ